MKVTKKLTMVNHEDLVNLFSTATYDSEWLSVTTSQKYGAIVPPTIQKIKEKFEESGDVYCREDKWADILLNGGTIVMVDYFDEDEDGEEGKCYPITLTDLMNGLNKAFDECPHNMENVINEDGDYYDYNNVMQVVMFGEVVYG